MEPRRCPTCGEGALAREKYQLVTQLGGVTIRDTTGIALKCDRCDEEIVTARQTQRHERRAAALVLSDGRAVSGPVLRYARKALGLTQVQLASLTEVRKETISRYESGDKEASRSYQLALVALLDGVDSGIINLRNLLEQGGDAPTELEVPKRRDDGPEQDAA